MLTCTLPTVNESPIGCTQTDVHIFVSQKTQSMFSNATWLLWDPRTKLLDRGPQIPLYKESHKRTKPQPRWHRVPGWVTLFFQLKSSPSCCLDSGGECQPWYNHNLHCHCFLPLTALINIAEGSAAACSFLAWNLVLVGLCHVLQLHELRLGRSSLTFAFLGLKKKSCFGPPNAPFCKPESEDLIGTSYWWQLWECVVYAIVSTKIAAELSCRAEQQPSPNSSPLKILLQNRSKTAHWDFAWGWKDLGRCFLPAQMRLLRLILSTFFPI